MSKTFEPLTLELVEEGNFIKDLNKELLRISQELLRFKEIHGHEAKGAKAELSVKIVLGCMDPDQDLFTIKANCSTKLPSRPQSVTTAISEFTDDHQPSLFVRSSGSDKSNPRQLKLSTEDGREIVKGKPRE